MSSRIELLTFQVKASQQIVNRYLKGGRVIDDTYVVICGRPLTDALEERRFFGDHDCN